jgi:RND family efflux transporter MFP subunit
LFCIDDRDYQNALAEAKAAHEQARQALAIEQGRRVIAQTEWEMLESSKWRGQRNKTLALREPQLKEKKAAVQMAAAKLARAALNLERARVSAPCDGVILTEQIAGGQYLSSDAVALRVACTDCYQVSANFSPEYSLDLNVRTVTVQVGRNRYQGRIKAVLPQIDTETRRKRALVEFKGQGVTLGAYASLTLPGPIFTNAIIIPKEALRAGNKIWLLNQGGRLEIRQVEVMGSDGVRVVVGRGLDEQDCIVLSHIASPLAGMELRTKEPDGPAPTRSQIGEGLDR